MPEEQMCWWPPKQAPTTNNWSPPPTALPKDAPAQARPRHPCPLEHSDGAPRGTLPPRPTNLPSNPKSLLGMPTANMVFCL
eukprot:5476811-Alexandrium_andersonii.AAC.1